MSVKFSVAYNWIRPSTVICDPDDVEGCVLRFFIIEVRNKIFHKYNCINTSLTAAVASGPRSVINKVTNFGSV